MVVDFIQNLWCGCLLSRLHVLRPCLSQFSMFRSFVFTPLEAQQPSARQYAALLALILVLAEVGLSEIIIRKVPYTEIDWIAYMQEIAGVKNGQLDYQYLRGDTGPLVYPAGFVYIYAALYWLTGADVSSDGTYAGANIALAQHIFLLAYVATVAVVLAIYLTAGRQAPPLAFVLLCLSKRVHSIFVLRLFNDCECDGALSYRS